MTKATTKSIYTEVTRRVGVSPDADGATVLAAVDEAIAETAQARAEALAGSNHSAPATAQQATAYTPPIGCVVVDQDVFSEVKDRAVGFDTFRAELAERVGCDQAADPPTILAAVDEALSEIHATAEDMELIDTATLAELRTDAELHRTARERGLVDSAIRDGRIPYADRDHWVNLLTTSPGAAQTLAGLPKGLIPVDGPRGYTGGVDEAGEGRTGDDYERLFG